MYDSDNGRIGDRAASKCGKTQWLLRNCFANFGIVSNTGRISLADRYCGGKGVFLVLEKVIDGRDMHTQMLTRPMATLCPRV
jgi:hypothetical protein